MSKPPNPFSAAGPMAGYLFQLRLALLQGLQMAQTHPNASITIEIVDDVAFGTDGSEDWHVQVKHSIHDQTIGDMSPDLWKTVRAWLVAFETSSLSSSSIIRILATTAVAGDGSALALLRPGTSEADRTSALSLLRNAAQTSTNKETLVGREAFLALDDKSAALFVSTIRVHDGHKGLGDCSDEIAQELRLAIDDNHLERATETLEGWWLGVVGAHITTPDPDPIPCQNIRRKVRDIAHRHSPASLPITPEDELGAKTYGPDDEEHTFVRQMRAIQLRDNVVERGVRDFYRSSAQRSRWVRDSLILSEEASDFDERLRDRLERKTDELLATHANATTSQRRALGQTLYFWAAEQTPSFRDIVEAWMTSGSLHGLADREIIRWHPDYPDHEDEQ